MLGIHLRVRPAGGPNKGKVQESARSGAGTRPQARPLCTCGARRGGKPPLSPLHGAKVGQLSWPLCTLRVLVAAVPPALAAARRVGQACSLIEGLVPLRGQQHRSPAKAGGGAGCPLASRASSIRFRSVPLCRCAAGRFALKWSAAVPAASLCFALVARIRTRIRALADLYSALERLRANPAPAREAAGVLARSLLLRVLAFCLLRRPVLPGRLRVQPPWSPPCRRLSSVPCSMLVSSAGSTEAFGLLH